MWRCDVWIRLGLTQMIETIQSGDNNIFFFGGNIYIYINNETNTKDTKGPNTREKQKNQPLVSELTPCTWGGKILIYIKV